MGKKKGGDETSVEELVSGVGFTQDEAIERLYKELTKTYGDGVIIPATTIVDKPKKCLSISPAINLAVGGGVYQGSWIGLSGQPGCGKTSLALSIARNAQKEGYPIFYLNVEARLKTMNLLGVEGLDIDKMHVINYVDDRSLTGEDFLCICENIITNVKNAVIIIDSVSSLCPTSEMAVEATGSIRPTTPKLLSHFIRKNTGKVYINNIIVIMIHHFITKTS